MEVDARLFYGMGVVCGLVRGQTYPESELFCEIEACFGPVERLEEVSTHRVHCKISVVQTVHYYGQYQL